MSAVEMGIIAQFTLREGGELQTDEDASCLEPATGVVVSAFAIQKL
jgi:hypothetical protein